MTNKALFHLGYPKCASTYLQSKIFPELSNVNFIGAHIHQNTTGTVYSKNYQHISESEIIEMSAFLGHLCCMDCENKTTDVCFTNYLNSKRRNGPVVVSDENFLDFRYNGSPLEHRIERLEALFQEGDNIIIMTRPLIEILTAMYRDHPITYVGEEKLVSFNNFIKSQDLSRNPILLKQKEVVRTLQERFGEENVSVMNIDDIGVGKINEFLNSFFNIQQQLIDGFHPVNSGVNTAMFQYRILKQRLKFLKNLIPRSAISKFDQFFISVLSSIWFSKKTKIHYSEEKVLLLLNDIEPFSYAEIFEPPMLEAVNHNIEK